MKTYLWPKVLGGGEHEEYRHVTGETEAPLGTVAFLVDGKLVCIAVSLLTEVNPQPEPGFYALSYKDGSKLVAERDGDSWYIAGTHGSVPWGAVRSDLASIARLVPAPEPVELPWERIDTDGDRLMIDPTPAAGLLSVTAMSRSGNSVAVYVPVDLLLRAVWTAASDQETTS